MTSSGKIALISGFHLKSSVSASMKAVLRVLLEVIEFSSCRLMGDRERRALLERLEGRRSASSLLDVLIVVDVDKISAVRSDDFRRLRLRLLGIGDDIEIALLPKKTEPIAS